VEQPEILTGNRIFVMFAQIAQVVGVIEVLQARGIRPVFFVIGANRPRILHSAMNQLLFAFPAEFKLNRSGHCQREYTHESNDQK